MTDRGLPHHPILAESTTPGVWNVYCAACSAAAGDYTYPCAQGHVFPPERMVAAGRAALSGAEEALMSERPMVSIPVPVVLPSGLLLDKPEYIQDVWDAFVKPDQAAAIPPSVEMRLLMAILRSVHEGLSAMAD